MRDLIFYKDIRTDGGDQAKERMRMHNPSLPQFLPIGVGQAYSGQRLDAGAWTVPKFASSCATQPAPQVQ